MIYENVADDANIIFGAVVDERLKDQVRLNILNARYHIMGNQDMRYLKDG